MVQEKNMFILQKWGTPLGKNTKTFNILLSWGVVPLAVFTTMRKRLPSLVGAALGVNLSLSSCALQISAPRELPNQQPAK